MPDSRKFAPPKVLALKSSPHKQERALATRRELIDAARGVFARHGFESARLEDIAARAGKSRGAFYANFCDKEDVFFALFEEDLARHQERVNIALSNAKTPEERARVMAEFLTELLSDKQRLLLNLEFKMYAIRHPRKQRRLSSLHAEMCARCSMMKINALFPELADADVHTRRSLTLEVGAVMDGLALNLLFNPESMTQERRARYIYAAVLEAMRGWQER